MFLPGLARALVVNQLLHRNVQRFQGGLVFKAHRLLYHSTLGLGVIKKKEKKRRYTMYCGLNRNAAGDTALGGRGDPRVGRAGNPNP